MSYTSSYVSLRHPTLPYAPLLKKNRKPYTVSFSKSLFGKVSTSLWLTVKGLYLLLSTTGLRLYIHTQVVNCKLGVYLRFQKILNAMKLSTMVILIYIQCS